VRPLSRGWPKVWQVVGCGQLREAPLGLGSRFFGVISVGSGPRRTSSTSVVLALLRFSQEPDLRRPVLRGFRFAQRLLCFGSGAVRATSGLCCGFVATGGFAVATSLCLLLLIGRVVHGSNFASLVVFT